VTSQVRSRSCNLGAVVVAVRAQQGCGWEQMKQGPSRSLCRDVSRGPTALQMRQYVLEHAFDDCIGAYPRFSSVPMSIHHISDRSGCPEWQKSGREIHLHEEHRRASAENTLGMDLYSLDWATKPMLCLSSGMRRLSVRHARAAEEQTAKAC
jgi:hypothetical protein